ncbi:phage virion morphogenesis protein [Stagnimonas aquatica]|uniref:Phage virion morphogenesis protein n=1 Tax=Stagnimonas aquatica TaxID=2689987 RepID=A0A3N0V772_9GAMM|nr:phage virion morphogenesis protein [Stagnimonas aquatica]ROH88630.1 phage virion morphogenesis protein [Stagnimonas aquatica]
MSGALLELDISQLDMAQARLNRLADFDRLELLQGLAAMIESQTRERIEAGGPGPDGTPWPAWSDRYAATRAGGQSLLMDSGLLLGSITSSVDGDSMLIGSNRVYARIHQEGGTTAPHVIEAKNGKGLAIPGFDHPVKRVNHPGSEIPPRPYLGVSEQNRVDLTEATLDFFAELIQ